jgi:hypothetical protein
LQALSAAVAVASPRPAMMASMAPALISVFMFLFCLFRAGTIPALEVIPRARQNPPRIFLRVVRFECITGIKNGTARDVSVRFRKQPF